MNEREVSERIQKSKGIYENVKMMLDEGKISEIIYGIDNESRNEVIPDIALVQCFHGTDIARIRATTTAIEFNL